MVLLHFGTLWPRDVCIPASIYHGYLFSQFYFKIKIGNHQFRNYMLVPFCGHRHQMCCNADK